MICKYIPTIRASTKALVTPRTNEPGLPELFNADIEALFASETVCNNFDGLCVPKIDQVTDLLAVHEALSEVESRM